MEVYLQQQKLCLAYSQLFYLHHPQISTIVEIMFGLQPRRGTHKPFLIYNSRNYVWLIAIRTVAYKTVKSTIVEIMFGLQPHTLFQAVVIYLQQQKLCLAYSHIEIDDEESHLQQQKLCLAYSPQSHWVCSLVIYNSRNYVWLIASNNLQRYYFFSKPQLFTHYFKEQKWY